MGCRDASSRLTVVIRISGQVSSGPSSVLPQSKPRISSAISPSPIIREGGALPLDCWVDSLPLEVREDDDVFIRVAPILTIADYRSTKTPHGLRDRWGWKNQH